MINLNTKNNKMAIFHPAVNIATNLGLDIHITEQPLQEGLMNYTNDLKKVLLGQYPIQQFTTLT
jgi:hypothetical protein